MFNWFKKRATQLPRIAYYYVDSLYAALNDSNPTVMFCENLIANSIASLPLELYFRRNDGSAIIAFFHPKYRIITKRPNLNETYSVFYSALVRHLIRYGNAFVFKVTNDDGELSQLILLDPTTVTIRLEGLQKIYFVGGQAYTDADILHIPSGYGYDGVRGKSIIEYARQSIQNSNKLALYTSNFYDNNILTRVKVTIGKENVSYEDIIDIADFYSHLGSKLNSGKPIIEFNGNKVESFKLSGDVNELMPAREFEEGAICQFFGVPYELLSMNKQGINYEQVNLIFKNSCLIQYTDRIEQYFEKLLTEYEQERYFLEFDYNEFLRPDAKTRNEILTTNLKLGIITTNEARKQINLPALGEELAGDVPIRDGVGPLTDDVIEAYAAGARLKLEELKKIQEGADSVSDNKSK